MPAKWIKQALARHRAVLVFGAIGVCNTVLHSGMVMLLVEQGWCGAVAAHAAGFALANTFSFFANAAWTFRRSPSWTMYRTFLAVSMLSLVLTLALAALADTLGWHYLAGLALVILCGPVLSFLLHRAFTFRAPQG